MWRQMDGVTKTPGEGRGDPHHARKKGLHEHAEHENARHDDREKAGQRGDPFDPPPATSGRVEEHCVIGHGQRGRAIIQNRRGMWCHPGSPIPDHRSPVPARSSLPATSHLSYRTSVRMNEPVIEVRGLRKVYHTSLRKTLTALDGVDFNVRSGELFGLLGPNGAGKTTTVKILLGLTPATDGKPAICGMPVADPESRRRVGYL